MKIFPQKSNRSRHVKNFHHDLENSIVIDNQHDEDTQNETIPLVVLPIDTVLPKVPRLPPQVPVPNDTTPEEDVLPQNEQMEDLLS